MSDTHKLRDVHKKTKNKNFGRRALMYKSKEGWEDLSIKWTYGK